MPQGHRTSSSSSESERLARASHFFMSANPALYLV